jgi:GcrA cell cycle regulator
MEYWRDDEVELLKLYLAEKMTFKQIAEKLGKTRNSVIGVAHRRGLGGFHREPVRAKPKPPSAGVMVAPTASLPEASSREARVADGSRLPQSQRCRWPIGDPRDKDFHFCNQERSWHSSYCDKHYRIAYQRGTAYGDRGRY